MDAEGIRQLSWRMRWSLWTLCLSLLAPTAAVACSCVEFEKMSDADKQTFVRLWAFVGYAAVTGAPRSLVCEIPPLRWVYALTGAATPVSYEITVSRRIGGLRARTMTIVQYEFARWNECQPPNVAGCQLNLSRTDTLHVLYRTTDGKLKPGGPCATRFARDYLKLPR